MKCVGLMMTFRVVFDHQINVATTHMSKTLRVNTKSSFLPVWRSTPTSAEKGDKMNTLSPAAFFGPF